MNICKILSDYKTLAMPLDMVAKNNNVSTGYVLKVVHHQMVEQPKMIAEIKEILGTLDE